MGWQEWKRVPGFEFKDILYEKRVRDQGGQMARITINRPKALNAFTDETVKELQAAFDDGSNDRQVGLIVFTGAGDKSFCAGGDIKWEGVRSRAQFFMDDSPNRFLRMCRKPVMAVVKGYAGVRVESLTTLGTPEVRVIGPQTLHIDITNGCNTNCVTCWDHSPYLRIGRSGEWKRQRVSVTEVAEILDDAADLGGLRAVILSGMGEPFTHPQIYELIGEVKRRGLHLTIITNLVAADEEAFEVFAIDVVLRAPERHEVVGTWDGHQEPSLTTSVTSEPTAHSTPGAGDCSKTVFFASACGWCSSRTM